MSAELGSVEKVEGMSKTASSPLWIVVGGRGGGGGGRGGGGGGGGRGGHIVFRPELVYMSFCLKTYQIARK